MIRADRAILADGLSKTMQLRLGCIKAATPVAIGHDRRVDGTHAGDADPSDRNVFLFE